MLEHDEKNSGNSRQSTSVRLIRWNRPKDGGKHTDPKGHGKGEHNKTEEREGTIHLNTDLKDKFDLKYPVNVRVGKVSTGKVTVLLFIKRSDWKHIGITW